MSFTDFLTGNDLKKIEANDKNNRMNRINNLTKKMV